MITRAPGIGRFAWFIWVFVMYTIKGVADVNGLALVSSLIIDLVLMFPLGRRLANIGRHPMCCLFLMIPILGFAMVISGLIVPPNYQQHRRFDLAAKITAGVLVSAVLLFFICLVIQS